MIKEIWNIFVAFTPILMLITMAISLHTTNKAYKYLASTREYIELLVVHKNLGVEQSKLDREIMTEQQALINRYKHELKELNK